MKFILRLLLNTLVILLVAAIVPGIHISSFLAAIIVAIILGIINVTLKPVLIILTLPLNIITLGLFTFVLNALLLLLVAAITKGFQIDGFLPALIGSLIISLFHFVTHKIKI